MIIEKYSKVKSKFQNKLNVPELFMFNSYKMYPRELKYDYLKHRYYIYIYLDPFNSYLDHDMLGYIDKPDILFGFEPWYVGKGTTGHGYRLNQHIKKYLSKQETNKLKLEKFKEIEKKMQSNKYPDKPKNWKEYQDNWIMVYHNFSTERELMDMEQLIINKIGTKYNNKGTLVNKITNYNQEAIKRIEDEFYA